MADRRPTPQEMIALTILSTWIAFVAVRIEVLNAAGGYILPRRVEKVELPPHLKHLEAISQPNPNWRMAVDTEERWRQLYIGRDNEGNASDRPLTPGEAHLMERSLQQGKAANRLRSFMFPASWLQYPLAAGLFVYAVRRMVGFWQNGAFAVAYLPHILVAGVAGFAMFYRSYFLSSVN